MIRAAYTRLWEISHAHPNRLNHKTRHHSTAWRSKRSKIVISDERLLPKPDVATGLALKGSGGLCLYLWSAFAAPLVYYISPMARFRFISRRLFGFKGD
jgi:hypothetical protein